MKHSQAFVLVRKFGPWGLDGLAGAASVYTGVLLTAEIGQRLPDAPLPLGIFLAVVHSAPVAIRRRYPMQALLVALVAAWAYSFAGFPVYYIGFASLFYLYSAGARLRRKQSLSALALAEVTSALSLFSGAGSPGWDTWIFYSVMLGIAWYLGDGAQRRQAAAEAHAARAAQLEAAREELARRAVTEERLNIARELHDIVAHSMSVVALHAGIGRMVIDSDRDKARHALGVIEATSRSALDEMRRLLGVLRKSGDETGELGPAPGLSALPVLVAKVVDSGLAVNVKVEGQRSGVPAGVDLAAYRIIQEALTNAVKHAGPGATATIWVEYEDDEIAIEVTDDGSGSLMEPGRTNGEPGQHHGLLGIKERVSVFGGRLEAGPRPEGGFRVAAWLPLEQAQ